MRNLLLSFVILVLTGCSSSSYILTGEQRAPTTPDKVQVYFPSKTPAHYKVIAEITAKKMRAFRSDQDATNSAIEMLKEQAAQLGANGLILGGRKFIYQGFDSKLFMTGIAIHSEK